MRFYRLTALMMVAASSFTARGDLTVSVGSDSVQIPAMMTTIQIPVMLTSTVDDNLISYEVPVNFGALPAGITNPAPHATQVAPLDAFLAQPVNPDADLVAIDDTLGAGVPLAANTPLTLYTIDFVVAPGADPGVVSITLATVGFAESLYSAELSNGGNVEGTDITFVPGTVTFTAIPEPSQLILAFLMVGLVTTALARKFFRRWQPAAMASDAEQL